MNRPAEATGAAVAYGFHGASSSPRDERLDPWASRAERAVELARLLGAPLVLRWSSGPSAARELIAERPETCRWAEGGLAELYAPGQWRPGRLASGSLGCFVHRYARPRFPGPVPFRAAEARPWGDLILPILRGAPPGLALEMRLAPAPAADAAPWSPSPGPPRRLGTGTEAPHTAFERGLYEGLRSRPHRLRWSATVGLCASSALTVSAVPRVVAALQAASRAAGANGLEFGGRLRRWSHRPPMIFLTDGEVASLLPHPRAIGALAGGTGEAGSPLLLGWEAGRTPVRLPCPPSQGRHLLVLGETGIGKSSLLVRLALAAAAQGAVLLMDPVGETAHRFIDALTDDQLERTTLVSPQDCPVRINALAAGSPDEHGRERAVADLVLALRRVRSAHYSDSAFWGPRLEEVAGLALRAAAGRPGGTLADALALLGGEDRGVAATPAAREAAAALRRRLSERPEDVEGARRLLAEALGSPRLRELLADGESTWNLAEALRPERITVVSADADSIGEGAARHLLAIYLALVWSELVARPGGPKTFVILDEAQWYAHGSATEILRLGRRANVHLWMATQALRSLSEELREAVLTNASDFVLFRGSPDEAREFSRWVPGLAPEELLGYPRGQALALLGKGERAVPIRTAGTLARDGVNLRPRLDALREQARRRGLLPGGGGPAGPPASTGGGPEPATASRAAPGLEALIEERFGQVTGPLARVALADLRAAGDPSGELVRRLGSELRRSGVIRETGRGPAGAFWVLDRHRWNERRRPTAAGADGPDRPAGGDPGERTAGPGQGF